MSYVNMIDYIKKLHETIAKVGVKESYFEFKSTHTNLDKGFDEFKRIFDLIEIQSRMATTKVYELEGIQLFEVRENDHYRSKCYYLMVVVDDLGNTITKKVSSLFAKKMVAGDELVGQPYCPYCKKPYRMPYTAKDKDCCTSSVRELSVTECWRDDQVGIECAIAEMQRYNLYKLHFENGSPCPCTPKGDPLNDIFDDII